ncbi:MAG: polyprenol monophosphomannose synthase [Verrucomicrobiota bacterium]|nr:polyprenol monophosphomannose synthase [Verrucomicrobiota bacterium]
MSSNSTERVSVIVPTLNEAENIEPLVAQILAAASSLLEIVIVDDSSNDNTPQRVATLAATQPVRLIERFTPSFGLSGAVITGARAALGDILVVMDADLSHPPEEIMNLVRPIAEDRADLVIGSRYVAGGTTPGWPLYRKAMSRVAAAMAYPITHVHDSMCGFFAVRRSLLLELAPEATGFKIAFEVIVRGGRELRVLEIPIAFRDRRRGKSKMTFAVALLFGMRWIAAASRVLLRGGTRATPVPALRPSRDLPPT